MRTKLNNKSPAVLQWIHNEFETSGWFNEKWIACHSQPNCWCLNIFRADMHVSEMTEVELIRRSCDTAWQKGLPSSCVCLYWTWHGYSLWQPSLGSGPMEFWFHSCPFSWGTFPLARRGWRLCGGGRGQIWSHWCCGNWKACPVAFPSPRHRHRYPPLSCSGQWFWDSSGHTSCYPSVECSCDPSWKRSWGCSLVRAAVPCHLRFSHHCSFVPVAGVRRSSPDHPIWEVIQEGSFYQRYSSLAPHSPVQAFEASAGYQPSAGDHCSMSKRPTRKHLAVEWPCFAPGVGFHQLMRPSHPLVHPKWHRQALTPPAPIWHCQSHDTPTGQAMVAGQLASWQEKFLLVQRCLSRHECDRLAHVRSSNTSRTRLPRFHWRVPLCGSA